MKESEKKAKELVERFEDLEWDDSYPTEGGEEEFTNFMNREASKQCALICVDEIIDATKIKQHTMSRSTIQFKWVYSEFWQEVKQSIIKL